MDQRGLSAVHDAGDEQLRRRAAASATGFREHDDANYGTGFVYRGNPTSSARLDGTVYASYDMLGNTGSRIDGLGRTTGFGYANNGAAPSSAGMGPYTEGMTWNTFLGLT